MDLRGPVVNGRIPATGELPDVEVLIGAQPYDMDRTIEDHVIVPDLIAQLDHPVLTELTLLSEILSIEVRALPGGTVPAVKNKAGFLRRLTEAHHQMEDADTPL